VVAVVYVEPAVAEQEVADVFHVGKVCAAVAERCTAAELATVGQLAADSASAEPAFVEPGPVDVPREDYPLEDLSGE